MWLSPASTPASFPVLVFLSPGLVSDPWARQASCHRPLNWLFFPLRTLFLHVFTYWIPFMSQLSVELSLPWPPWLGQIPFYKASQYMCFLQMYCSFDFTFIYNYFMVINAYFSYLTMSFAHCFVLAVSMLLTPATNIYGINEWVKFYQPSNQIDGGAIQ